MTQITVKDPTLFEPQLIAYAQSFGLGAQAAGYLAGFELYDNEGHKLGGGLGTTFQADLKSVMDAFENWEPAVSGSGVPFGLLANVTRASDKLQSGFVDLASALEFCFPVK